ncbi:MULTISPECIES: NAD(P)/FAD-dependent oxidoreductase [unclassified Streptomyces]|uniref:NAD(P)/FAD-dependent oxidoreductase n=1 Tax=unclassified Streptomyces TaxID=2593676 RepID=UPI00224EE2D0|nr:MULTISPECIES: FAD-dependent oxidoreductase [unclassified Streptomyces]MCX5435365.1 FAD-dependent oxidoreductase [Streptomyces sp. NBC_00063]WSE19836.1 FAD-dependent oxidoreductase [Streptomyces sp. NBC_01397]WUB99682.1 FAD-dependent oxidoreductase [Streptomyces sp. NBC_00569]
MNGNVQVVVIGGGYGGVTAANSLARRDGVSVTLVNPRPEFVSRIRLHQLVTGSDDAVEGFGEVLGGDVRLVVDTATRIDAAGRRVSLAGGDTLSYDYLVYAVGSGAADPGVPGAAEFAHWVSDFEGAQRLRSALDTTSASASVTVVGAGPTGLETAAELAESGRKVTLVCGDALGPSLHARVRRPVARRLAKLGVTVLEGPRARVREVTQDAVQLDDARSLPSAVTIWTAGFRVPDLAARSGLRTDTDGRLLTDATLTSVDDVRIVAAGDAAVMTDQPFRMSCQAAVQLGPAAADTILRRIAGKAPARVRMFFAGQCLSLGRNEGITQFSYPNDKVNALRISGRPGAGVKEIACRFTLNKLVSGARKASSRASHGDGTDRLETSLPEHPTTPPDIRRAA